MKKLFLAIAFLFLLAPSVSQASYGGVTIPLPHSQYGLTWNDVMVCGDTHAYFYNSGTWGTFGRLYSASNGVLEATINPADASLSFENVVDPWSNGPQSTGGGSYRSACEKTSDVYDTSNSVNYPENLFFAPPTCTSWTYNDWGACSSGTQSRTVATSSPSGCAGGSPVLSQSCGGFGSGSVGRHPHTMEPEEVAPVASTLASNFLPIFAVFAAVLGAIYVFRLVKRSLQNPPSDIQRARSIRGHTEAILRRMDSGKRFDK